jgi:hypothetical protein
MSARLLRVCQCFWNQTASMLLTLALGAVDVSVASAPHTSHSQRTS